MSERDDQATANLGNEERIRRSIAAKQAAHRERFPVTDSRTGRAIPADEWAKRPIYNGTTYLGRADELGIDE